MIKASGSLQDLRSGLYGKRKTEWSWRHAKASDGRGGVVDGRSGHLDLGDGSRTVLESDSNRIGPINLAAKCAGARSAGNPHAACEVAGAGNGATELAKRARRGKPRTQPSQRPDGPPRQFPTLPGVLYSASSRSLVEAKTFPINSLIARPSIQRATTTRSFSSST